MIDAMDRIRKAISFLKMKGEAPGYSSQLESQMEQVRTGNLFTVKTALWHIGEMCNPKALGELFVTNADHRREWLKIIDELHGACASAFNRLEQAEGEPPTRHCI